MNFFHHIHRSVVEPAFYQEVIHFPRKKVVLFIVKLVVLTVLILTIAHVARLFNSNTGLPALLPRMFPGMVITGSGMTLENDSAYNVNGVYSTDFFSLLHDQPRPLVNLTDSTIVAIQKENVSLDTNSIIRFLFTADNFQIQLVPRMLYWTIPYADFIPEGEFVTFTPETVRHYLFGNLVGLFSYAFMLHILRFSLNIVSSIFILSFAAFIFRTRYIKGFGRLVKIASFASVPIPIVTCLAAIAGARNFWISQVALFVSAYILFRAITFLSAKARETTQGDHNGFA